MDKASPLAEERVVEERVEGWSYFWGFLVVLVIGSIVSFLRLTGRVHIEGRDHLRDLPHNNVLFASNHPSMLDFWLLLFVIAGWRGLFNPRLIPWQACDRRNFTWITRRTRASFKTLRLIPIDRDRTEVVLRPLLSALLTSWVLLFPEGGRSAKQEEEFETAGGIKIGQPKEGVGLLIAATRPKVVVIIVRGAQNVVPIGTVFGAIRNIWRHKISVTIGEPFQCEQIAASSREEKKQRSQKHAHTVMGAIADLDGGVLEKELVSQSRT